MHHELWQFAAIIFFLIVIAKILSSKTSTVDVLWLILFGAIGVNIGILPEHHETLEIIGEWGIFFVLTKCKTSFSPHFRNSAASSMSKNPFLLLSSISCTPMLLMLV